FFQAEDGIRDFHVTGVQTCALPILRDVDHAVGDGDVVADVGTDIDLALFFAGGDVVYVQDAVAAAEDHDPVAGGGAAVDVVAGQIGRASCRERVEGRAGGGAR